MSDPNDSLTLTCKKNGDVIATHTCRPAPSPETPQWSACIRDFAAKVKQGQGGDFGGVLQLLGVLNTTLIADMTFDPEPVPDTPEWIAMIRDFAADVAEDL